MNLEIRSRIEEIAVEISALQEERQELVEFLADLPSDNPLWDGPDENGGYVFVPLRDLQTEMRVGTRAEKRFAEKSRIFNTRMIVLEDRELDALFLQNFNGAKGNSSIMFNYTNYTPVNDAGEKLPGYSVVTSGNKSPYEAREWFEGFWSDEKQHRFLRSTAERQMRNLDKQYSRLNGEKDHEEFRNMYPNYVPK